MRYAAIALLLFPSISLAQSPASRAAAALALAADTPPMKSAYSVGRERALLEHRHLVVWVGVVCPVCEAKLCGCVHVHLSLEQWQRLCPDTALKLQGVVVGKLVDGNVLDMAQEFEGLPSMSDVIQILEPRPKALTPQMYAPVMSAPTSGARSC